MKILIRHFGTVTGGKPKFHNKELFSQQLAQLEGKEFELVIKERHKKPTLDQYGYYRGAILGTCHGTEMFSGFDSPDQIHSDYFAPRFLGYTKMVSVNGKNYEVSNVRSLADLDRKEVSEFIERVIADCAMNGIEILSPDEYYIKHYNL